MQAATSDVLHNQDNVLARVDDFIQCHNMLVAHLLHQLNLPLHALPTIRVHQLVFFVDLHRNLAVRRLV
jgi:hypothetical protein